MSKRILSIVMLLGLMIAFSASAQPTTAPAGNEETVTRVYDISDLLWQINDYYAQPLSSESAGGGGASPFGGGGGGGPAAMGGAKPSGPIAMSESIMQLLKDTVAAESWKDNGGNTGSMRELSGKLVITQSAENHRRVQEVLQALRVDRGRMVVVRSYWLLLDPASVPETRKTVSGTQLSAIEDNLVDAKHLYCAAQTTCFSGQTVHVTSGRKRTYLTSLQPVVGQNAVGYQPTLDQVRSGVVLQLTPHLEPEGPDARIVLDLQAQVTQLGEVGDKIQLPSTTQPSDTLGAIDRMNEVSQELQTTVRVPLGIKVLIGGMTLEPTTTGDVRQLYLVVQADAVK